jgi:hypothetical protein
MNQESLDQDISEEHTAEQKIKLAFWTLRFSGEYKEFEKHFLVSFFSNSINKVRMAILTAIIIYAIFGILDAALIPDFKFKFRTLRYLVAIPLLLGVLGFSFTRIFRKKVQFISSVVVFVSGLTVILIIMLAPALVNNYYFPGLILILVMNYGLMKLRFIWASSTGIILSFIYIFATFQFFEMPYVLKVFNSFFLITINVVGIFISREFEIHARKEYFSNQLLKIERMKLKTLNARLEAKIKDKASQFSQLQKEIMNDEEPIK